MARTEIYITKENENLDPRVFIQKTKDLWRLSGNKIKDIAEIKLYFNLNENACYYVITYHDDKYNELQYCDKINL